MNFRSWRINLRRPHPERVTNRGHETQHTPLVLSQTSKHSVPALPVSSTTSWRDPTAALCAINSAPVPPEMSPGGTWSSYYQPTSPPTAGHKAPALTYTFYSVLVLCKPVSAKLTAFSPTRHQHGFFPARQQWAGRHDSWVQGRTRGALWQLSSGL